METINKICKWLFFIVLALLLALGGFYFYGVNQMIAPEASIISRIQTTVTVFEGVVDFYRIKASGKREFQRAIQKGEIGQIRKVVTREELGLPVRGGLKPGAPGAPGAPGGAPGAPAAQGGLAGFYSTLEEIFPKVIDTFMDHMDARVRQETSRAGHGNASGTFNYRLSEPEMNDFVGRANLNKAISNMRISLKQDGMYTSAHLSKGPLEFDVSQKGRVFVDPQTGNLALHIDWIKMGIIPLPGQLLRNLENAFADGVSEKTFTIQLLQIDYMNGAMNISARWNTHGTTAVVSES